MNIMIASLLATVTVEKDQMSKQNRQTKCLQFLCIFINSWEHVSGYYLSRRDATVSWSGARMWEWQVSYLIIVFILTGSHVLPHHSLSPTSEESSGTVGASRAEEVIIEPGRASLTHSCETLLSGGIGWTIIRSSSVSAVTLHHDLRYSNHQERCCQIFQTVSTIISVTYYLVSWLQSCDEHGQCSFQSPK